MLQAAHDAGPIKKGDLFYYAHMSEEGALSIGAKVQAGQQIGIVGDTGEGREVTRGKFPPHLHLGWYDASGSEERTRVESGAMNPYPLLLWLEAHGGTVSGGKGAFYCEAPQNPVYEPTGVSADLDTGDPQDARPSPVVGESRDDRGSPERAPSVEEGPGEEDKRAGTRGESPEAVAPDETKKKEVAGDEHRENRASRPATGEYFTQKTSARETIALSPGSARLFYSPAPSAEVPGEAEEKEERDGWASTDAHNSKEHDETSRRATRGQIAESHPGPSDGTAGSDGRRRCVTLQGGTKAGRYASITRAKGPETGRRAPIEFSEWLRAVRGDPELRMNRGGNKGLALWTGHPEREEIRFYLCGGDVMVESPDGPTTKKIQEIADALGAKIRDDGDNR